MTHTSRAYTGLILALVLGSVASVFSQGIIPAKPVPTPAAVAVYTHPVFQFDLTYADPSTGEIRTGTDFEMKASINNFADNYGTVYWGHSAGRYVGGYLSYDRTDKAMAVHYTDVNDRNGNGDTRETLIYVSPGTNSLSEAIGYTTPVLRVIVKPSQVGILNDPFTWMTSSNTNLQWVWRPFSLAHGGPTNAAGLPVWFKATPTWE